MKAAEVTILGCHAGTPRANTESSAQFLKLSGEYFLIDCGEGTQKQLRRYRIGFNRIGHIFISHLHGDHFFGLIGFLSSLNLMERKMDLYVYSPKGLKKIIELQLQLTHTILQFPLHFKELTSTDSEQIYESDNVEVYTVPLKHRIYSNGFLFREKPGLRKLNIEAVEKLGLDKVYYLKAKQGQDVPDKYGNLISNNIITTDPEPQKSYAYCSDTLFRPEISQFLKGVNALYHEATFAEEHAHLTKKTMHSTAKEAATLAQLAEVDLLIIGHFSTRYSDTEKLLSEAKEVFPNTIMAKEGLVVPI